MNQKKKVMVDATGARKNGQVAPPFDVSRSDEDVSLSPSLHA